MKVIILLPQTLKKRQTNFLDHLSLTFHQDCSLSAQLLYHAMVSRAQVGHALV
jgi:hypothetical protein